MLRRRQVLNGLLGLLVGNVFPIESAAATMLLDSTIPNKLWYKGKQWQDAGCYYCPYTPLQNKLH